MKLICSRYCKLLSICSRVCCFKTSSLYNTSFVATFLVNQSLGNIILFIYDLVMAYEQRKVQINQSYNTFSNLEFGQRFISWGYFKIIWCLLFSASDFRVRWVFFQICTQRCFEYLLFRKHSNFSSSVNFYLAPIICLNTKSGPRSVLACKTVCIRSALYICLDEALRNRLKVLLKFFFDIASQRFIFVLVEKESKWCI